MRWCFLGKKGYSDKQKHMRSVNVRTLCKTSECYPRLPTRLRSLHVRILWARREGTELPGHSHWSILPWALAVLGAASAALSSLFGLHCFKPFPSFHLPLRHLVGS